LWKRGLWWKCEPNPDIERVGMETLHLRLSAPHFYPDNKEGERGYITDVVVVITEGLRRQVLFI